MMASAALVYAHASLYLMATPANIVQKPSATGTPKVSTNTALVYVKSNTVVSLAKSVPLPTTTTPLVATVIPLGVVLMALALQVEYVNVNPGGTGLTVTFVLPTTTAQAVFSAPLHRVVRMVNVAMLTVCSLSLSERVSFILSVLSLLFYLFFYLFIFI